MVDCFHALAAVASCNKRLTDVQVGEIATRSSVNGTSTRKHSHVALYNYKRYVLENECTTVKQHTARRRQLSCRRCSFTSDIAAFSWKHIDTDLSCCLTIKDRSTNLNYLHLIFSSYYHNDLHSFIKI